MKIKLRLTAQWPKPLALHSALGNEKDIHIN